MLKNNYLDNRKGSKKKENENFNCNKSKCFEKPFKCPNSILNNFKLFVIYKKKRSTELRKNQSYNKKKKYNNNSRKIHKKNKEFQN